MHDRCRRGFGEGSSAGDGRIRTSSEVLAELCAELVCGYLPSRWRRFIMADVENHLPGNRCPRCGGLAIVVSDEPTWMSARPNFPVPQMSRSCMCSDPTGRLP